MKNNNRQLELVQTSTSLECVESRTETTPCDYVRQIAALTVLLEMIERRMQDIRITDPRPHHAAVQANIRTALDYERKVLEDLTDPNALFSTLRSTIDSILSSAPSSAIKFLE